jgi:hypothetical protein
MKPKQKEYKEARPMIIDGLAAIVGLLVLILLGIGLSGCGTPNARSYNLACFLKEGFVACQDRATVVGPPGPVGPQGEPGQNGTDGNNGRDGVDGRDGIDADQVEVVYPCPGTDPLREVLIKVDGAYFAYLTHPAQGRLVLVPENQLFQTVGPESCRFTIIDGQVVTQ